MLHLPLHVSREVLTVWILIIGLVLFFLPHLLRELGMRDAVIASLPSVGAYKAVYSLVALTGLGLIIFGKTQSSFVMLWQPIYEMRFLSYALMIPALILVVAGNLPMSHIRYHLRNPMLLGVSLWGLAHLWSNGDRASILLFGAFATWAGFKFVVRGLTLPASTSSAAWLWDGIAVIAGLVAYVLLIIFHGQLFGVGLGLT